MGSDARFDPGPGTLESRSPWVAQLAPDGPLRPLADDLDTDVVIVGAGIAGVATAFFALRQPGTRRVLLLERDRVGRGATGHNAGQLTTYFERPLADIARVFGASMAIEAQRAFDGAHDLLDLLREESGASVRIERFDGHMGMATLDHVLVHLENGRLRRDGGLAPERCVVSEDAEFLEAIPDAFDGLYAVVPQAEIRARLELTDDRFHAVLTDRKGCGNSGLLVQQVLAYLERAYPDRFRYHDGTRVERVVVGEHGVTVRASGHDVAAGSVVLCTNGFTEHVVMDASGRAVELAPDQQVTGIVGYMAAFMEPSPRTPAAMSYVRNATIGSGDVPYVYVTRRTYDRAADVVTLTCMGGPEHELAGTYVRQAPFPAALMAEMDRDLRPYAQPARPPGQPYDFQWHGLMGYNDALIRVVGAHPEHPQVLYNLGCNGVGFLPSIAGAERIGRLLDGAALAASIFDPRGPPMEPFGATARHTMSSATRSPRRHTEGGPWTSESSSSERSEAIMTPSPCSPVRSSRGWTRPPA